MLQHLVTTYQRIFQSRPTISLRRRNVPLAIVTLEERATPAVDVLAPIQAPPIVQVATPAAAPAPAVRSDLFGVGDGGVVEESSEFDEMVADETAPVQEAEVMPAPETDAVDEAETLIVENLMFVPQMPIAA